VAPKEKTEEERASGWVYRGPEAKIDPKSKAQTKEKDVRSNEKNKICK
jgi:hypothetical protein